ncbi:uncharacterized protein EV422DRAFT_280154 [Fimicolochytrium jonesii]|uniref:uncharacterized protein n=1 Tax=Fimicolochytrium jonesii TaxID=1396493 RepID=UPI0022FEC551|nr:uncharacterized protein EV422DRAFT_280154 [Fimicolochytrium jonesii]KAI8816597.1 hypothetical protein EV422DRAFT_280154 [Fimicolochytrium jonesii]
MPGRLLVGLLGGMRKFPAPVVRDGDRQLLGEGATVRIQLACAEGATISTPPCPSSHKAYACSLTSYSCSVRLFRLVPMRTDRTDYAFGSYLVRSDARLRFCRWCFSSLRPWRRLCCDIGLRETYVVSLSVLSCLLRCFLRFPFLLCFPIKMTRCTTGDLHHHTSRNPLLSSVNRLYSIYRKLSLPQKGIWRRGGEGKKSEYPVSR